MGDGGHCFERYSLTFNIEFENNDILLFTKVLILGELI